MVLIVACLFLQGDEGGATVAHMGRNTDLYAAYVQRFPTYARELAKKLACKATLEKDATLKIPRRVWLAFLTPPEKRALASLGGEYAAVRSLKEAVLRDFKHPARFLHRRGARGASDVVTLALLEIIYDLKNSKVLLSPARYEAWHEVADAFGLWKFRYALEDAIFESFDPDNYALFESVIREQMKVDTALVRTIRTILSAAFEQAGLRSCTIENRAKNIGGVYRKVAQKGKSINDIYDIHGFRILCETEKDCYVALEAIHRLWPHYRERFKDYIHTPKKNGYRSIHTVLSCIDRKPIEFQIRTREMDVIASSGPANHADYKRVTRGHA